MEFLGNEKSGHLVLTSIISIIVLVIGILSLGQMFGMFGLAYSLLISDKDSKSKIGDLVSINILDAKGITLFGSIN